MKLENIVLLGFVDSAVEYLDQQFSHEAEPVYLGDLDLLELRTLRDELKSRLDSSLGSYTETVTSLIRTGNEVFERFIEDRKQNFHQDLDVRGMRGDEAVDTVMHFIDDAILMGMSRVRILHGTGSGILRQLIRQYLNTVPNVKKAKDEHVQFGGAGITVVDLD